MATSPTTTTGHAVLDDGSSWAITTTKDSSIQYYFSGRTAWCVVDMLTVPFSARPHRGHGSRSPRSSTYLHFTRRPYRISLFEADPTTNYILRAAVILLASPAHSQIPYRPSRAGFVDLSRAPTVSPISGFQLPAPLSEVRGREDSAEPPAPLSASPIAPLRLTKLHTFMEFTVALFVPALR